MLLKRENKEKSQREQNLTNYKNIKLWQNVDIYKIVMHLKHFMNKNLIAFIGCLTAFWKAYIYKFN